MSLTCKTDLTVFHGKFEGKECLVLLVADGKSITLNQEISGRLQIDQ